MSRPLCIFHDQCPDGMTAAWVVARALETVDLHGAMYDQPPSDTKGRTAFIVDFSYPRAVLADIVEQAESVVLLDHHQTALDDLDGFSGPGFRSVLDMNRSGARIAWDFFHPGVTPPAFLLAIEDRDLWRFSLPNTAEMFAAVTSRPYTLKAWDEIAAMAEDDLVREGRAINRYREQLVSLVVPLAQYGEIAGHRVPIVNCIYALGSDVAAALAVGRPFAAYYFDHADSRHWGLRSAQDGMDVAKIAQSLGGGGHVHAAGFRTGFDFTGRTR